LIIFPFLSSFLYLANRKSCLHSRPFSHFVNESRKKRRHEKNVFRNQFVTFFLFPYHTLFRDGLSHSAKRLSEPHRLDLMRNITELLGRTFPSQFVFPVLGHEDVQNSDYKDYKSFLVSLGSIWRQWLPLEALQTFEKGMYHISPLSVSVSKAECGY
jgi:hypothetical protein